jgi:hypothetical protein
MTYTAYEHFFIQMYRKKTGKFLPDAGPASDVDGSVMEFRERKNGMIKTNLIVTMILVLAIGCSSFPLFSSTPFSNAYSSIFVALPIMLVIPPIVTGRVIGLVPSADDAQQGSSSGGTSGQTWVLELLNIELLARISFTLAVMYDLCSLSVSDNVIVGF